MTPTMPVLRPSKYVEAIKLEGPDDIATAKAINKGIADALGGKDAGYDNCQNLDRLLRVPFTKNLPDARKRAKGRKIEQAGNVEYWPEHVYADFELPSAPVAKIAARMPADEDGEPTIRMPLPRPMLPPARPQDGGDGEDPSSDVPASPRAGPLDIHPPARPVFAGIY